MKKSTLFLIILVAIFFTSTLVLLYLNLNKRPATTSTPTIGTIPTETPTPDPTVDWKTYTNDKYNFSFKYPSYLHQIKSISSSNSLPSEQFQSNDYQTEDTGENTTVSKGLSLAYTYNYSMGCDTSEDITRHELNIITLDNHEARRYFVSWEGMIFYAADIFLPQSCLHISLNYGNNYNKDQILDIFNQILSTIKFIETSLQKTPAVIPRGWKSDSYRSDSGHGKAFTIAHPSSWFFEGIVFRNFDYNDLNPSSNLRPEYIKCDVYDSSSGSSTLFNIVDFATDIVDIAKESDNSYKIIRGNHKIDIGENIVTTYQLSANGNILANVTCYAFTKSDAKIVDQIVKTIRY